MDNRNLTKVTDGKEIFNVYYSGGVWIREGTNKYYDEDDWQNNVITAVKEFEPLKLFTTFTTYTENDPKIKTSLTKNIVNKVRENIGLGMEFKKQGKMEFHFMACLN